MKLGRVGIENDEHTDQHEDSPQDMLRGYEIFTPDMEKSKTEKHLGWCDQACISGARIAEAEEDQAIIQNAEKECGPQYVF